MSAEADAVCGAAYGTVSEERVNRRNGYRAREFDTRAGTIELAIPKLRQGTYFPEWLLERRKRAERSTSIEIRVTPAERKALIDVWRRGGLVAQPGLLERILGLAHTAQYPVGDREQQRPQLLELLGPGHASPSLKPWRHEG